jgi:hypothetical protein
MDSHVSLGGDSGSVGHTGSHWGDDWLPVAAQTEPLWLGCTDDGGGGVALGMLYLYQKRDVGKRTATAHYGICS